MLRYCNINENFSYFLIDTIIRTNFDSYSCQKNLFVCIHKTTKQIVLVGTLYESVVIYITISNLTIKICMFAIATLMQVKAE